MQNIYPELLFSKGQAFLSKYNFVKKKHKRCKETLPLARKELIIIANNLWHIGEDLYATVGLINDVYDAFDKKVEKLEAHHIIYYRTLNQELATIEIVLDQCEKELSVLDKKGLSIYKIFKSTVVLQNDVEKYVQELDACLLTLVKSNNIESQQFKDGKSLKIECNKALVQLYNYKQQLEEEVESDAPVSHSLDLLQPMYREVRQLSRYYRKMFNNYHKDIKMQQVLN